MVFRMKRNSTAATPGRTARQEEEAQQGRSSVVSRLLRRKPASTPMACNTVRMDREVLDNPDMYRPQQRAPHCPPVQQVPKEENARVTFEEPLPSPTGSTSTTTFSPVLVNRKMKREPEEMVHDAAEKVNKRGSIRTSKVKAKGNTWTEEDDERLRVIVASPDGKVKTPQKTWQEIAHEMGNKVFWQCQQRWNKVLAKGLKKGKWSREEDNLLRNLVHEHTCGDPSRTINWKIIQEKIPGRHTRQCRERWTYFLRPGLNHSAWSDADTKLLLSLHDQLGPKWSEISKQFEGRTADAVKSKVKSLLKDPDACNSFSMARQPSAESGGSANSELIAETKDEITGAGTLQEHQEALIHDDHLLPLSDQSPVGAGQGGDVDALLSFDRPAPVMQQSLAPAHMDETAAPRPVSGEYSRPRSIDSRPVSVDFFLLAKGEGGLLTELIDEVPLQPIDAGLSSHSVDAPATQDQGPLLPLMSQKSLEDVLNFNINNNVSVAFPPSAGSHDPFAPLSSDQSRPRSRGMSAEEFAIFHSRNDLNLSQLGFDEDDLYTSSQ